MGFERGSQDRLEDWWQLALGEYDKEKRTVLLDEEIKENPRARSAKLRVIEKL